MCAYPYPAANLPIFYIATQGKTTKTLRRTPEMPQFAAFRSATQGKLPKNVRSEQLKKRNNFKIQKNLQGGKHNFYHFCRFFHSFVKGC